MLWSHDVPCGVLCFHVVWLVGWVEWCVGCLSGWVVWQLRLFVGCLAGCGMLCGVCTLWCVLWHYVVCSVMSHLFVHLYLLPFQGRGGGLVSMKDFCSSGVRRNYSSGDLATL